MKGGQVQLVENYRKLYASFSCKIFRDYKGWYSPQQGMSNHNLTCDFLGLEGHILKLHMKKF